MLTIKRIVLYLIEGLAITAAIYLVTKRQIDVRAIGTLALVIGATYMVLDLYAPGVGAGARQGSGFGLGFGLVPQVAGYPTPMNRRYYEGPDNKIVEGMDDPVALNYYSQYNPNPPLQQKVVNQPNLIIVKSSELLKDYNDHPFSDTVEPQYAKYP